MAFPINILATYSQHDRIFYSDIVKGSTKKPSSCDHGVITGLITLIINTPCSLLAAGLLYNVFYAKPYSLYITQSPVGLIHDTDGATRWITAKCNSSQIIKFLVIPQTKTYSPWGVAMEV